MHRTSDTSSRNSSTAIDLSDYRPPKRRKGLNSRFDSMIKSVNSVLSYRNTTPASSRKRILSSGTSSVSSHDIPKTPVDAYSNIQPAGNLGKMFTLLKMKKSPSLPRQDSDGCLKPAGPPMTQRDSLPVWLADTFRSLEAEHPLRGLLSPSCTNVKSNTPPLDLFTDSHEEKIFAFSPFDIDKEGSTAYREDKALNIESASSAIPTKPILSNPQHPALPVPLPFSTPGCFASVRKPMVDGIFQKALVIQQAPSHTNSTMHPPELPPPHLRPGGAIERKQITGAFSNLIKYNDPSSDFQEHDAYINHVSQVPGGVHSLNVYATPGPTFACSHPVYFDSPTEDPSLSDSLRPESYDLDLNAIDFRWHPFSRSNLQEGHANRHPSSPLGNEHPMPNLAGDRNGWDAHFAVDQLDRSSSSEELPSLTHNIEVPYLGDAGPIQPSNNVNSAQLGTIAISIGPRSSLIDDVPQPVSALTSDDELSPLRNEPASTLPAAVGDGKNLSTRGADFPHGEEARPILSGGRKIRPSTPIRSRQPPVSPPSAPQKARSSHSYDVPHAPVGKTASALSWMMPLKFSKRASAACEDDHRHPGMSRVSAHLDSHDSIESWNDTH